mmetsp:Transcript_4638/g.17451  ORF Transcript_4638/g.17451 Transcript_4638/m.17451 type:complete len:280 (+) Transcript_4638:1548-2387(+)
MHLCDDVGCGELSELQAQRPLQGEHDLEHGRRRRLRNQRLLDRLLLEAGELVRGHRGELLEKGLHLLVLRGDVFDLLGQLLVLLAERKPELLQLFLRIGALLLAEPAQCLQGALEGQRLLPPAIPSFLLAAHFLLVLPGQRLNPRLEARALLLAHAPLGLGGRGLGLRLGALRVCGRAALRRRQPLQLLALGQQVRVQEGAPVLGLLAGNLCPTKGALQLSDLLAELRVFLLLRGSIVSLGGLGRSESSLQLLDFLAQLRVRMLVRGVLVSLGGRDCSL